MNDEMKAKREALKAMSRAVKSSGQYETVNEGLVDIYRRQGHTEIHSFKKWLEQGYCVKKGEKALLLWGQPRTGANKEKQTTEDKDEFSFFPLAYVFSQRQVQPLKELAR